MWDALLSCLDSRAQRKPTCRSLLVAAALLPLPLAGCAHRPQPLNVVAINDVTATEDARGIHAGIWSACREFGFTRYWNAPTHGDDYERQIDLMDRHLHEATAGLLLLPDNPTAPLTEVLKARDLGIRTVILHGKLAVDPGPGVYNVLSDATMAARIAIEQLYSGSPSDMPIALTGVSSGDTALLDLENSFLEQMRVTHPHAAIVIVTVDRPGQRAAEAALASAMLLHRDLGAVFALQIDSIRGALQLQLQHTTPAALRLVGAATDAILEQGVRSGAVAALVTEDRYTMGERAVQILAKLRGGEVAPRFTYVPPLLLTADSLARLASRPPFNGTDR